MTPLPATDFEATTAAAAALSAAWLALVARRTRAVARNADGKPADAGLRTLTASAPFALVILWLVETRIGSHAVTAGLAAALVTAVLLQAAAASRVSAALEAFATWLASLAMLAATAILAWQAVVAAL